MNKFLPALSQSSSPTDTADLDQGARSLCLWSLTRPLPWTGSRRRSWLPCRKAVAAIGGTLPELYNVSIFPRYDGDAIAVFAVVSAVIRADAHCDSNSASGMPLSVLSIDLRKAIFKPAADIFSDVSLDIDGDA